MDSEQKAVRPSSNKAMSQKQKGYIESLLIDKKVDENYKQIVRNVLKDGLSSMQASKIIDFLKSCIEFKRSFVVCDGLSNMGVVGRVLTEAAEKKGSGLSMASMK